MRKNAILSIFLLFISLQPLAQNKNIIFFQTNKTEIIGESVYVLEDKNNKLDFQEVTSTAKQSEFKLYHQSVLNFGNTASTFWIKFNVINQSPEDCVLEVGNASIEKIDIFICDENRIIKTLKAGYAYRFYQREYLTNTIQSKIISAGNHKSHTIYIRLHSTLPLLIPLRLGSDKIFAKLHQHNNLINGIYIGFLLIILLFNVFTYYITRRKVYLYYVAYLFCFGLSNLFFLTGYTQQYFTLVSEVIGYYFNILVASGYIFLILFTVEILETRVFMPNFHKLFYFLWGLSGLVIVETLCKQWYVANFLTQLTIFFVSVYLAFIGIIGFLKGEKQARLFTLAIIFSISGVLILLFITVDILPFNFYTRNSFIFGSLLEILLLSTALVEKIRQINEARRKAEISLLRMKENENEKLEKIVQERTEEIAAQNEEILTQNEELSLIQEELMTHRDILAQQNNQLKDAKTIIEEYNQKLEMEVASRTADLQKANATLAQYNRQLEQFAFITAHNLRSPVARILGLGSLMELPNINFQETLGIIENLVVSTRQLDDIIKDLNNILSISKTQQTNLFIISLTEEIVKLNTLFEKEIQEHDIKITSDFSEIENIKSVPAYLSSILYNLVSNSIKYRDDNRQLHIHISSQLKPDFICISVADNGLGIDLEKYREKLFTPYQRFHLHTEGKGLGLYLSKTQIETLHGRIKVESTPGNGATFFIYLLKE